MEDKKSKWLDITAVIAVIGWIVCEFSFPLADKAPNTQLAPAATALESLSTASGRAMSEFLDARSDFYKRTMGHTRNRAELGLEIYKLTALQLQYLSYFSFASPLLLDEANTLNLLDNRSKNELSESKGGAQLLIALKDLIAVQPRLTKCISDAKDRNRAIEQALEDPTAPDSTVKFEVATINGTIDTIQDRHSRWLACQKDLERFDRNMGTLITSNPIVFDELKKQSKRQKIEETALHWLCNMLMIVSVAGRGRFASSLSEIFGK